MMKQKQQKRRYLKVAAKEKPLDQEVMVDLKSLGDQQEANFAFEKKLKKRYRGSNESQAIENVIRKRDFTREEDHTE